MKWWQVALLLGGCYFAAAVGAGVGAALSPAISAELERARAARRPNLKPVP
jgi:hypothetical protein